MGNQQQQPHAQLEVEDDGLFVAVSPDNTRPIHEHQIVIRPILNEWNLNCLPNGRWAAGVNDTGLIPDGAAAGCNKIKFKLIFKMKNRI